MKKEYIFESFPSVASFVIAVNERPLKEGWGSRDSRLWGYDFTGTKDYEEATKLALYGDKKSADAVEKRLKKLQAQHPCTEDRAVTKFRRTVAGSRPCVPAAIIGHPCSMYRRYTVHHKQPVVTIFYSISMNGGTETSTLELAGAKIAQAVEMIERSGVRVSLFCGNTSCTESQSIGCFVQVKDSDKDFNLLRMAYAIINPSFFRRHWFSWAETKAELKTKEWRSGYGRPLYKDEEKETLEKIHENCIKCDYLFTTRQVLEMEAEDIANKVLGNN